MKISRNDLQQIIQEEALRMFRLEKLEEAKRAVDQNIRLISEGKKKVTDEELEELWAGIKSVLGAGAQKVQQFGQKVADVYKQGEQKAKMEKLIKQKGDLSAQLKKIDDEIAKIQPPQSPADQKQAKAAKPSPAAQKKPAAKPASAKPASKSGMTNKAAPAQKPAAKAGAKPAKASTPAKGGKTPPPAGQSSSGYSVTE